MPGIIIVTAKDADVRLVNRLLLYLRDYEFAGEDLSDADRFAVLTTKAELQEAKEQGNDMIDQPPLQEFTYNEWAGLSLEEVEKIMIDGDTEENGSTSLFLLLDDEGVANQTIILAERGSNDPEEEGFAYVDEFNKVRVPWESVYSMWCNLDIANMNFDEFCNEDDVVNSTAEDGTSPRRWWTYKNFMGDDHYEPFKQQAQDAIKELRKLDLA